MATRRRGGSVIRAQVKRHGSLSLSEKSSGTQAGALIDGAGSIRLIDSKTKGRWHTNVNQCKFPPGGEGRRESVRAVSTEP